MPRLVYSVAASLGGHIEGVRYRYGLITAGPEIDFAALHAQFDVLFMGRRT